MNLATVRLGLDVGLERVAATLEDLGAEPPRELYPSLLLGAIELTPIQVAQLYNTIANGGFYSPLRAVHSVVDGEGARCSAIRSRSSRLPSPSRCMRSIKRSCRSWSAARRAAVAPLWTRDSGVTLTLLTGLCP